MILSHKHEFIFIKTRKTAGTSMEIALAEHCGPDDVITPIEEETIRETLGFRGPQNTTVPLRNHDWQDWKSLLKSQKRRVFYNHVPARQVKKWVSAAVWENYFKFCFERNPFDRAISQYYYSTQGTDRPSIGEYLRTAPPHKLQKFSNWSIYTIEDKIAVDFVGRFERLHADLEHVWSRIGLPPKRTLPRAKSSQRKDQRHYSEVLAKTDRRIIADLCSNELANMQYTYEEP